MRKVILVEGKTDDYFIKVLRPDIETNGVEIQKLKGLGKNDSQTIDKELNSQKTQFIKSGGGKLGIVLDLDDETIKDKIAFLNKSLKAIFDIELLSENQPKTACYQDVELEISCHFIKPNLDILLRGISKKPSNVADCVVQCLTQDGIMQKEQEKEWIDTYMRYDICDFKERSNAKANVTYAYTNSKNAWDLGHENLDSLKGFLREF
jgi:competence transcription factor ComK